MLRKLFDYLLLAGLVVGIVFLIRYFGIGQNQPDVVVLDGDSLRLKGSDIRLYGIDAPEYNQTCQLADGKSYNCGRDARRFLRKLVRGHMVKCRKIDLDRYDRDIAICTAGDTELNLAMVENGWAVAYLSHSFTYARAEKQARKARKGIWRGKFVEPEDWRAENR